MLDANILIAAVVWRRWPHHVVRHAAAGDFRLVLSQRVIDEATEAIRLRFPGQATRFRRLLAQLKPEIAPEPSDKLIAKNLALLPDPEDVPIALAAIQARVDYFVSEDKHFTGRSDRTETLHRRLKVMLAGTFLREVMGWSSSRLDAVRAKEQET
jgi:predicted nucleic acid-binding protein